MGRPKLPDEKVQFNVQILKTTSDRINKYITSKGITKNFFAENAIIEYLDEKDKPQTK